MNQQQQPQQSSMESETLKIVDRQLMAFQDNFVRRNGGILVNTNNPLHQRAINEANLLIASQGEDGIPVESIQAALDLLAAFCAQPFQSEQASKMTIGLFASLAQAQLLSPITEKDEWKEADASVLVNTRDNRVVKDGDKYFFTQGIIFTNDEGKQELRGRESWVEIELPVFNRTWFQNQLSKKWKLNR
ncbi:hypothetical protein JCM19235_1342 [Vibrio maritimus]|uniref:Uncharacterized protein n=1 Tax=Vibrio maritimus TaxID=990268 RepID=A0A090S678_9VIBR|nr:hypothetical protein JCM19235_1342 [Vibrio maritimus]